MSSPVFVPGDDRSPVATPGPTTSRAAGTDAPVEAERTRSWVLRVWVLVLAFLALTLVRSADVGIPVRDPKGSIFLSRIAISLGGLVVLAVADAVFSAGRGRRRWRPVLADLRARWTGARILLVTTGLLAYHLVYFSYHNLKSWDVFNASRDEMLASWDRWLFLGHDPAVLLHDLLGQHYAMYVLMVIYESFSTLLIIALVCAVTLPTRVRDSYVFLCVGAWVWIMGVGSYYLIPSLGPFDSDPQNFAGLPHTMIQETQDRYMGQRAHLLAHPGLPDAFAQVSAFASLHVAITTFLLLMARYYRLRRVTMFMSFFLLGTLVATVYLGWHFAVDDVAGLLIAALAMRLGTWMIYPHGRPEGPVREPVRGRVAG